LWGGGLALRPPPTAVEARLFTLGTGRLRRRPRRACQREWMSTAGRAQPWRSIAPSARGACNRHALWGLKRKSARKASIENPLCSHAGMSAAASASSRPDRLNHRMSRFRTRAVSSARSPGVMGRAGRNVMPGSAWSPVAVRENSPSVTHTCRCTCRLSAEPFSVQEGDGADTGRVVSGPVRCRRHARANPKLRMPQRR